MKLIRSKRALLFALTAVLCVTAFLLLSNSKSSKRVMMQEAGKGSQFTAQGKLPVIRTGGSKKPAVKGFPQEARFVSIAENQALQLKADPNTGHFTVTDKKTGEMWRSFPDPTYWNDKQNTDSWKTHMQSPFLFRYVEMNVRKDMDKESSFFAENGVVSQFETETNGFKITYDMPGLGIVLPVEVILGKDFVETRILQNGLTDGRDFSKVELKGKKDPKARLVAVKLFPFLGAETSDVENGFLFIPDGPGALIDFKRNQPNMVNFYNERIYGEDWAYSNNAVFSQRLPIKMPVFGIKTGNQAILGVVQQGTEYAGIFAAPSKTFNQYNWATAEHQFRYKFFQPTNSKRTEGFFTYSTEMSRSDRAVRYYFMVKNDPGYVDLAARYRQYLMDELNIRPSEKSNDKLNLHVAFIGADTKKGFLWDSYMPLTSTMQATEIVKRLYDMGVDHMTVLYDGWQNGGSSRYGGPFPVDKRMGGNEGMKAFIRFAHAKNIRVLLDAESYSYNNTGRNGFRRNRDGLRDLSSTVIDFQSRDGQRTTFVSPKFMQKQIKADLPQAAQLQADGFVYGEAVGDYLNTDFNENHPVTRVEARKIQEDIMRATANTLGSAAVKAGNAYSLPYVSHLYGLNDDYSYDMFTDRTVPFVPIALHGLVSYSTEYANLSDDYATSILKGIEYGAEPSFLITYAPAQELQKSISLRNLFSTHYDDWLNDMVATYQRYVSALGGVKDRFITDHRKLAEGVYETTYSNGRKVIVNYNATPYTTGKVTVNGEDFAAEGGD